MGAVDRPMLHFQHAMHRSTKSCCFYLLFIQSNLPDSLSFGHKRTRKYITNYTLSKRVVISASKKHRPVSKRHLKTAYVPLSPEITMAPPGDDGIVVVAKHTNEALKVYVISKVCNIRGKEDVRRGHLLE